MKMASAEGWPKTQDGFFYLFKGPKKEANSLRPGLVMVGELNAFFSMVDGFICGLNGRNTMAAFIGFCLLQLSLGGFQVLKSGAHVGLFFHGRGSHGYRRGKDSQQDNQC